VLVPLPNLVQHNETPVRSLVEDAAVSIISTMNVLCPA